MRTTSTNRSHSRSVLSLVLLLALALVTPWSEVRSADHREAPLINEDGPADIADVFAFVSPTDPTKVVFAMTVNGFAVPAARASYSFSNDVLYQIKIDNTGDAREDLVIQALFEGYESLRDSRCPAPGGGQFVTILGPARPKEVGAENRPLKRGAPELTGCTATVLGPSPAGIRAWAGLTDDPFVADVGQLNRILGGAQDVFREVVSPALGPLRGRPVRADGTSGVDAFGGFNVSFVAIEVPISLLLPPPPPAGHRASHDRKPDRGHGDGNNVGRGYLGNNTTIGVWGTTSRSRITRLSTRHDPQDAGPFIQIQRAGHQVIKTVFVPVAMRDFYNRSVPAHDAANFSSLFPDALTTTDTDGTGNTIAGRAALLDIVGVTSLPAGAPLLLPPSFGNTDRDLIRKVLLPDVLRLDLALTPPADFVIANNGLQNGRRFGDDVVDILLRIARQLADVKFPDGSGVPGSGPVGTRRALDCSVLPACPDRRVLAVLQGTDFIEPDAAVEDLSLSGNDRPFQAAFPFVGQAHPLPGNATPPPGTVGFPPQQ